MKNNGQWELGIIITKIPKIINEVSVNRKGISERKQRITVSGTMEDNLLFWDRMFELL